MTLADKVYQGLQQDILELKLAPGTPLSEVELGKRYKASRTPVREAIQRLGNEGLVRVVHRRGAFVAEVSLRDVVDLFQMREALECFAARLASRSSQRAALLERVAEEMERDAADLVAEGRFDEYFAIIARMDEALVELAGNRRLRSALTDVWQQIQRVRRLASNDAGRLRLSVDEHRTILAAVLDGDEDAAFRAVASHVQYSLEHVLSSQLAIP